MNYIAIFEDDKEMDKAFEYLVHHNEEGFTGYNEFSMILSQTQLDLLRSNNIKFEVMG